jgi:hypothetical protein
LHTAVSTRLVLKTEFLLQVSGLQERMQGDMQLTSVGKKVRVSSKTSLKLSLNFCAETDVCFSHVL